MKKHTRRWLWVGLGMAVVLGLVWQVFELADAGERLDAIPAEGENFTSMPVPLSRTEETIFGRARALKRLYRLPEAPVVVTVVDGTRNRHGVHDPLHCFLGDGWRLQEAGDVPMPNGTARLVKLERKGQVNEVVYWFSTGDKVFTSGLAYWATASLRRLTLGLSGPEPVLVVIQPGAATPPDWQAIIADHQRIFRI